MICRKCGLNVAYGVKFCPRCGFNVAQQTPVRRPASPYGNQQQSQLASPSQIKLFGILALALGAALGVPGIVFGIIARTRAKEYINRTGALPKDVELGNLLGLIGFIAGIAVTALSVLVFLIVLAL